FRKFKVMQEIVLGAVSAVAGGGLTGWIIKYLVKNYLDGLTIERKKLEKEVTDLTSALKRLETDRIVKLEIQIKEHLDKDDAKLILFRLNAISSRQGKIDDVVTFMSNRITRLVALDKARYDFLNNINKALQDCKKEHKI
ncbi:MAG: hypothetical protein NT118_08620, partial [Lentisphaerae bacterium]|nr:hypothetical protein [Lentisphaerota bacterium]